MEMLPLPTVNEPPKDGLEIRELTPEEIKSQEYRFKERGCELPDPRTSNFVGVIRNGKIVGFGVVQLLLHAEPFVLDDGESAQFVPLVREVEKLILKKCGPMWVYLFAPAGRITQLAQTMGMQLEPWCVLSKLIQPNMPAKFKPIEMDLEDMPVAGEPV
jgi:hypothetical protein